MEFSALAMLDELTALLSTGPFPSSVQQQATACLRRTERDLRPRLQADGTYPVVVGIVGPNNAGKSTLFSSLVGGDEPASPVSPAGGLTRVLVGVAHPDAAETAARQLSRRFAVDAVGERVLEGGDVSGDGAVDRLLLLSRPSSIPEWLVLIDTPDFDSVHDGNLAAAEALLAAADLLIVVVTPHTYQNRAVVDFLRDAVAGGRPYCLVYNEARSAETARAHTQRLERDLGPAAACFYALHDLAIQEGNAALSPRCVDRDDASLSLDVWLQQREKLERLTRASVAVSWRALADDLQELSRRWSVAIQPPRSLRDELRRAVGRHAQRAARAAFPADPFREALKTELDRRSPLHRSLRYGPARLAGVLSQGVSLVRGVFSGGKASVDPPTEFRRVELGELTGAGAGTTGRGDPVLVLWESLAREVAGWQGVVSQASVASDFAAQRRGQLVAGVTSAHTGLPLPFDDFREDCRVSIVEELENRGEEAGLQWIFTGLRVLPPVAAVAVMLATGVIGDVGAGVAYLAAEPLISRAVGREFVEKVQASWASRRTDSLVGLLEAMLIPKVAAELDACLAAYDSGTVALVRYLEAVRNAAGQAEAQA